MTLQFTNILEINHQVMSPEMELTTYGMFSLQPRTMEVAVAAVAAALEKQSLFQNLVQAQNQLQPQLLNQLLNQRQSQLQNQPQNQLQPLTQSQEKQSMVIFLVQRYLSIKILILRKMRANCQQLLVKMVLLKSVQPMKNYSNVWSNGQ